MNAANLGERTIVYVPGWGQSEHGPPSQFEML